jgi:putative tryptophan/tyrosine transport system substrate-binding protein
MKRREFLTCIGGAVVAWPRTTRAQQATRPHRIGVLDSGSTSPRWAVFAEAMRGLGWIEGESFVFERRFAEDQLERLPQLAAELVRLNVDVIAAETFLASRHAKDATPTIPVVMIGGGDPVAGGLVTSLARPGGNVTGLSYLVSPEIGSKRIQLLKEALPNFSRLALLWYPNPPAVSAYTHIRSAAGPLGIEVLSTEVRSSNDFKTAYEVIARQRPDALMAMTGPIMFSQRKQIAEFALMNRLPSAYPTREFVEAGGLMSYGPDMNDLYRRATGYVDKILKGAKPGDLPVEEPKKFEFVINLKTAKTIGLEIPPKLLALADEVIE